MSDPVNKLPSGLLQRVEKLEEIVGVPPPVSSRAIDPKTDLLITASPPICEKPLASPAEESGAKLISLHLPRTGGSSFNQSLRKHFRGRLTNDYRANTLTWGESSVSQWEPIVLRNRSALLSSITKAEKGLDDIECVHGHFMPVEYLLVSNIFDVRFVTWMRHPVDRVVSHYNHYLRQKGEWTLEQFCLSPKFRNLYSQYLWAFPLENFDFIGITEHYKEDLEYFSKNLLPLFSTKRKARNFSLTQFKENVTPRRGDHSHTLSTTLRKEIENYHNIDMDLYRRALNRRLTRQNKK